MTIIYQIMLILMTCKSKIGICKCKHLLLQASKMLALRIYAHWDALSIYAQANIHGDDEGSRQTQR